MGGMRETVGKYAARYAESQSDLHVYERIAMR